MILAHAAARARRNSGFDADQGPFDDQAAVDAPPGSACICTHPLPDREDVSRTSTACR
jgi:hypothetical protein